MYCVAVVNTKYLRKVSEIISNHINILRGKVNVVVTRVTTELEHNDRSVPCTTG